MAKTLKQRLEILEAAIGLPTGEVAVAHEDLKNHGMFRINDGRQLFTLDQVRAMIPEKTVLLIVRYIRSKVSEVKNDLQQI